MKKTITYPTQGTCSQAIIVTTDGDRIDDAHVVEPGLVQLKRKAGGRGALFHPDPPQLASLVYS